MNRLSPAIVAIKRTNTMVAVFTSDRANSNQIVTQSTAGPITASGPPSRGVHKVILAIHPMEGGELARDRMRGEEEHADVVLKARAHRGWQPAGKDPELVDENNERAVLKEHAEGFFRCFHSASKIVDQTKAAAAPPAQPEKPKGFSHSAAASQGQPGSAGGTKPLADFMAQLRNKK